MPRKIIKGICEICKQGFESRRFPFPRSCTNKECRSIIKKQANGNVGQNQNPKTFLRLMKSKYGDRLILKNNPYKEVV